MEAREKMKAPILKNALLHVPFDGWSQEVLERGALEAGFDPSFSWRIFPKGPADAIAFWSALLDQEMIASLPSPDNLRVTEKVQLAVKTRLGLLIPYREASRQTAKYLALPTHLGLGTRLLYHTVNEIWYYAGDTSTDYNFYTKRGLLAWVYSTTFFYWLKDDSEGFEKTWRFLDQRLKEVLALPKIPKQICNFIFPWTRHGRTPHP